MPLTPDESRQADALEAIAATRDLTPCELARYMDLANLSHHRVEQQQPFPDWREYRSSAEVERELAKRTPR